jgi:diguanylate cyclase (GGDEF)-like protein
MLKSTWAIMRHNNVSAGVEVRKPRGRDIIKLVLALGFAIILVFFLDTGSVADWVSKHKDTKIDEIIVVTMVLVIVLGFLSRLELSRQLKKYEELHVEMTKLSRESALLGELGHLLQSCLCADEAYRLITDRARILFPGSCGALCTIANSRDLVEVKGTWGEPALAERFFAPKDCWGLRRGRVHLLGDPSDPLACAHFGPIRPRWAMCVPMMAHGEALGLLCLDGGTNPQSLPEEAFTQLPDSEQRLARTLAEHAALALANLNLRETLRIQSVRDPLTGLYNRRYMEESLERELRRSIRKGSSLGVMMIDVDHFKRFNDMFGHEAGDSVLRTLADLFRTQLRGEDVACRYGGEEFTMILPEASMEATRKRAEQLREAAKNVAPEFGGKLLDGVTLSIGVSSFPEDGNEGEVLLRAADAALYRAKDQGRDRVEMS